MTSFNFFLVALGMLFFGDFNVGVWDLLPDFAGLILIWAGIKNAAYLNEHFLEAIRSLKLLFAVSVLKFLFNAGFFLFGISLDDGNNVLLFVFCFSLCEVIFFIPMSNGVRKGLSLYLSLADEHKKAHTLSLSLLLMNAFIILKAAASVVVRATVLLSDAALAFLDDLYNIYSTPAFLTDILFFPALVVVTLSAVFVFSIMLPPFWYIHKQKILDPPLNKKMVALLAENPFFLLEKDLSLAFSLFVIGCAAFLDFFLDGINILPDLFTAVFFFAGANIFKKYGKFSFTRLLPIHLFYILTFFSFSFGALAGSEALYINDGLTRIFTVCYIVFQIAACLCLFASSLLCCRLMSQIENLYSEYLPHSGTPKKIIGSPAPAIIIFSLVLTAAKLCNMNPPVNEFYLIAVNGVLIVCVFLAVNFLRKKRDSLLDRFPARK